MNRPLLLGSAALALCAALGARSFAQPTNAVVSSDLQGQIGIAGMYFSDQTASSGINVEQRCEVGSLLCQIIPYTMAGGGATGDFDRDGDQDLLILGGGLTPDRLYINDGQGVFTDEAAAWGVDLQHGGVGACVGDYNNDGWLDIYITSFGLSNSPGNGQHILYRNNGNGTFTNVAAQAGVNFTTTTTIDGFGSCFGDLDLDGDLDLVVCGWVDGDRGTRIFRNDGDGTFTDITDEFDPTLSQVFIRTFSPRIIDMDGDRYPELLLVADFGESRYYANDGTGTLVNMTAQSNTGQDEHGMGTTVGDFNNDGLMDWYVTSIEPLATGNKLYQNLGNHRYGEVSYARGVDKGRWGWGAVAIDVDHDGQLDIVENNGWNPPYRDDQMKLFMQKDDGSFVERAATGGLDFSRVGRGLLNLDADGDGDQDLVVFVSAGSKVIYYRNDAGTKRPWLRVFLDTSFDQRLAPDGFGAKVRVRTGNDWQVRSIDGGCNYLSQSELSAHFGLNEATVVDELVIEWSTGLDTTLYDVAINQTMTFVLCPADCNGDGIVDLEDVQVFLRAYADGDLLADLTGDGLVTIEDLNAFNDAIAACG